MKIEVEFLYRDAGNYKWRITKTIDTKEVPSAATLKVGDEILMGENGSPTEDECYEEFSKDGIWSFDEEADHCLLEVEEINVVK